ncbi:uncharacterized protein DS421_13g442940 [Arachis hypogaea]|uniref:EF-hand domain-containing protein n=1 Tax=Arachis hypogaea TaxID=3818 RepID=A0A444XAQ0_ARAHY|nr:uncharacterized protein DS421_13g442940 [Arachis hypogaea]RYQ86623.1 hypothetical protein Ahy_B10g106276 [Arachis hypogaea]
MFEQKVETLRDLLLRSPSTAIFSGDISSSEDLLQQRSPPAMSAPATISLLRRLLQRRSPSSDVSSSDDLLRLPPCRPVSSLPNLQCLPFVLDQQGSGKALASLINQVLDLAKIEAEMDWDNNGQVTIREFFFGFIKWVGIDADE